MNKILNWLRSFIMDFNEKKLSDINFKDENFKKLLLDLKINSLAEVIELNCERHSFSLTSINEIKYFPNLETLTINSYDLEELNLAYNLKLKNITIEDSEHLTEIDFSKNKLLEVLILGNLFVEKLDLKTNINLKKIFLDGLNELEDLDLTDNINLQEVHLEHMRLDATLNENNKLLKIIYCSYGTSCSWDENGLPELEELTLENSELGSVNVTCFPKLKKLDITWNQISEIDLSKNVLLEELSIQDNAFSAINLEKNVNLKSLSLGGDHDIESNKHISYAHLDLTNNTKLLELYINKSGLSEINLSKNLSLETLCIDENPIKSVYLSKNISINRLIMENTMLESLDLSENKKLGNITLKNNKLKTIQFPDVMNIEHSSLSKDLLEDKTISRLMQMGLVFKE